MIAETDTAAPTIELDDKSIGEEDPAGLAESDRDADAVGPPLSNGRRTRWAHVIAYGLLPAIVVVLSGAAGYLHFRDFSTRQTSMSRSESIHAATDITVALLSYQPDTADKTLGAAAGRLTGAFHDSYLALVHGVVIPGAKQKHISSVARVPAAASVSASTDHAVVVVFIDQDVTFGSQAPTSTASCVRVTLDKISGRWLMSKFDPI